jgi:hypothetical protein
MMTTSHSEAQYTLSFRSVTKANAGEYDPFLRGGKTQNLPVAKRMA